MKPFATRQVRSARLVLETDDGSGSVVLDSGVPDRVAIRAARAPGSSDVPGILLQNDPQSAVQLTGGNVFVFCPNGNVVTTASQAFTRAANLEQSLETLTAAAFLGFAAARYPVLDNTVVPGLHEVSRLYVVPDALGTTVDSLLVSAGNENPDGRGIWVQNVGGPGQVLRLSHQAEGGSAGGRFLCPGLVDFDVPPGGGVRVEFGGASAGGLDAWLVQAR